MIDPAPHLILETNALLLGWGAVSDGVRTDGLWSERERAVHINQLELMADEASRSLLSSAEYMLNIEVFHWLMRVMGQCQLNIFANLLNHQLQNYVSWRPNPFAVATDAFQVLWKDQDG